MSFTLATLKSAIQDYQESTETSFVSNLDNFIKTAEERILKNVQLDDFKKNQTGTVTNGNTYLTMPSDYLAPFSLAVIDSYNLYYVYFEFYSISNCFRSFFLFIFCVLVVPGSKFE